MHVIDIWRFLQLKIICVGWFSIFYFILAVMLLGLIFRLNGCE